MSRNSCLAKFHINNILGTVFSIRNVYYKIKLSKKLKGLKGGQELPKFISS